MSREWTMQGQTIDGVSTEFERFTPTVSAYNIVVNGEPVQVQHVSLSEARLSSPEELTKWIVDSFPEATKPNEPKRIYHLTGVYKFLPNETHLAARRRVDEQIAAGNPINSEDAAHADPYFGLARDAGTIEFFQLGAMVLMRVAYAAQRFPQTLTPFYDAWVARCVKLFGAVEVGAKPAEPPITLASEEPINMPPAWHEYSEMLLRGVEPKEIAELKNVEINTVNSEISKARKAYPERAKDLFPDAKARKAIRHNRTK